MTPDEIESQWRPTPIPTELADLWSTFATGMICYAEDWRGLKLLEPAESRLETARIREQYSEVGQSWISDGEFIVGIFGGLDDRLMINRRGEWIILNAIAPRSQWTNLGKNLETFIAAFLAAEGVPDEW